MNINHQLGEAGNSTEFFSNFTGPHLVEDTLRTTENLYRSVVEAQTELICRFLPDGTLTFVNFACCRYFGRSRQETIGKSFLMFFSETDRESVTRNLLSPDDNYTVKTYEYRAITGNGELRWQQWIVQAIFDEKRRLLEFQSVGRDITDLKQTEEALRQTKERLERILQSLDDVVWSVDASTGKTLYISPAVQKVYGRSVSEFFDNSNLWREVIHPIDRQQLESKVALLFATGSLHLEYRIVRPNGEVRWLHNRMRLIRDEGGKAIGIDGIATDITERKQAQEELAASKELFRLLLEGVKDYAIYMLDKNGCVVSWNAGAERIYGFKTEEIIGQHFSCFFGSEDVRSLQPVKELQLAIARGRCEIEGWRVRSDGSRFWANVAISTLHDDLGNLRGFAKVTRDITDRKQAEELLQQQKEILQTIFDRIPVMIAFFDASGKIILINRELERLLGWNLGELEKITLLAECYPDPEYRQQILDFMLAANGKWRDMKTRVKDGRIIDTSWANIRLSDGSTIGIGQDITERKSSEEALHQAYSNLRDREEQYRILTTHAPVGIFQTNDRGKVNFVNQRWCEIVGISPEEAYGHSWLQALNLDRRKRTLFEARQADKQKANTYEIRFQAPDGKIVWVVVNTAPLQDAEGNFAGIIGTILDITDRKFTEKALRKSEAKFQKLAANLPGMIYQFRLGWDGSISFPYVSAGCRDIYELEPEEIQQNANLIIDIIHPEDKEKFEESVAISAKTLESWRWEGRIFVNGKIKWVQGAARPERKANGDVIWDGLLFDISDRKTAELRLAKINECFLKFSSNPTENINSLTALCGELLGSNSAFYTGIEGEKLTTLSAWHKYLDSKLTEHSEIDLCYEAIEAAGNGIFTVGNLLNSHYFENNLKIARQQKRQTYFGWSVKGKKQSIGALCAVYQKTFIPKEDDEKVMGIIATAIGVEEERRRVEEALRLQTQQERSIGAIAQRIRQTLNLDEILNTTVDEVLQLLECDRVLIFRLYPDGTGKVITEAVKSGWPATLGETFPNECFPPECYENYCQGNARTITNIASDLVGNCLVEYLQKMGVKSKLVVPILQHQTLWGLLIVHQCSKQRNWQKWEIDLLSSLATQAEIAIQQSQLYQQLESANQELHRLVTVDGLTQVANRRRFDEYLLQEWPRLAREQAPLSLIMCDVDFFKLYNDTYGHQAGDECLKQVACAIENSIKRPADLVARYGGEEFAVILPNTDIAGATYVAEKIRIAIKALQIPHCASRLSSHVTISLGVTTLVPFPAFSPEMLINAADRALYHAKEQGRDSCYVAVT